MPESSGQGWPLVLIGVFLLAGFFAHVVGGRAHVPRVTLLLLLGLLAGPSVLDFVPHEATSWFPLAAQLALSMVGFGLGEQFLGKRLRETGRSVLLIALFESVMAALLVGGALALAGFPLPICLVLGGIAPATAPAATVDVIRESGARGPVTDTVLGVAAVDDAFCIVIFSALLATAESLMGTSGSAALLHGLIEIGGSVALGLALGVPMFWLTGRARPGMLTLIETLGFVLIASGLSVMLGLSYLLVNITMGAVVANFARHHTRPFHAIAGVRQPFVVVFFLLAGYKLQLSSLPSLGLAGLLYLGGRSAGKVIGANLGARLAGAPLAVKSYTGWCLLPQAGVALGLALLASQRISSFDVLGLLVATTFVFEVVGPLSTRFALSRAGETAAARRA